MRKAIKRYVIVLAAWLPFFAIWVFFAMLYAHYPLGAALVTSMISMGSASLLGIAAWHVCRRWPWPLRLDLKFYLLQIFFASVYSILWSISVYGLEAIRAWNQPFAGFLEIPISWLATSDGSLAVRAVRGSLLCGADAESAARKRDACRAC